MNMYSFGHKKTNNNDLTYMWNLIKAELIEQKVEWWLPEAGEEGKWGNVCQRVQPVIR